MSRWFRVYDEMLDDPKVQRLHPALFKVLINLWCVASRNDGLLPTIADIGFSLRMSEDETFRAVSKLASLGFIDTDDATGEQRVHAWDQRQFRSDLSTDRVRAHRKKLKTQEKPASKGGGENSGGNDHETFRGTPPDTETETDNSVANATGEGSPNPASDFCKAVFDSGKAILTRSGMNTRNAGALIGRWRKTLGDAEILTLIRQSEAEDHSDPAAWLTAAVETRNGNRSSRLPARQGHSPSGMGPTIDAAERFLSRRGLSGAH